MTELFLNPRPVHDGRGSGSSNEGHDVPRRALLSFQRPLGGVDGSRRLTARASLTKKAPRRGARLRPAEISGRFGLLLRGCSFRIPKQELPPSITRTEPP